MKPIVTTAEMRELDRATMAEIGLPGLALMETAGRAVAAAALEMLGGVRGPVAVVCGPGNNGGDGYVAARVLRASFIDAEVYLAVARDKIKGDAAAHLAIYERAGGVVHAADGVDLRRACASSALVVDALFGIGLARPIGGHLADVVAAMNLAPKRLAIDIPSGLDTDTGRVLGTCVEADRTVAMAAYKPALAGAPGFVHCGHVEVADIGVPPNVLARVAPRAGLVEASDLAVPRITAMDHKGTRGHVLVIGGMAGMRGAGRLAALAALRAGAGLVTLAATGEPTAGDSVMTRSIATGSALGELVRGKAAIAIGPGLGRDEAAAHWAAEVLASGVPAVVDADALFVAGDQLASAAGPVVITPHPGEAARLLGTDVPAIEADRFAAARALAEQTRAIVVLKGARTIVCDGDFCAVNPTGGPSLGTGGSGDVLAGVIAALLAQRLVPVNAARTGVFVHGRAGDELAKIHGTRGVVSSDLPEAIARVIGEIPRPA